MRQALWIAFAVFTTPAALYFALLEKLWCYLQARRLVKKLAESDKPKDQLIRLLVYKMFGM